MITFIMIFGVLLRVLPMVGVLWLIWHVSRTPTPTGLRSEREAAYWWPPTNPPESEVARRSARVGRPLASGGKSARRVRVLAPMSAPPTAG